MAFKNSLEQYIKKNLKNRVFIVSSNREPYSHTHTANGIKIIEAVGGVHNLLNLIAQVSNGIYVAHGSGDADKEVVDKYNRIKLTTDGKSYTLKRIFLSKKEIDKYYYGFANQTLWPLCHAVFVKPIFDQSWWEMYKIVNRKFTDAILEEIGEKKAFVWLNDYHLALVPQMLRSSGKDIKIGTFWHIPWPTYEIFRVNPWGKELLMGLLGNNFLSFHRGYHVQNFLQCVQRELEAKVNFEPSKVTFHDFITKIDSLPAGIDYEEILQIKEKPLTTSKSFLEKEYDIEIPYIAIGVERLDYTKGLIERLKMIDKFLEKYPQFIEKFAYLGVVAPSRQHIPAYRQYSKEFIDLVEKINWKYSTTKWHPIYLINQELQRKKILSFFKDANCGLVTSLDDGMNLVAKEYVLSCQAEKGILVLSKFTGAARDLRYSIHINPYNIDEGAEAIYKAITMPSSEKKSRNLKMREELKDRNIYKWAINFINRTLYD